MEYSAFRCIVLDSFVFGIVLDSFVFGGFAA